MEKLKQRLSKKVGGKDLLLIEKVQNEKSIGKDQNFFNDTATTEIYTRSIVGSVRCV